MEGWRRVEVGGRSEGGGEVRSERKARLAEEKGS